MKPRTYFGLALLFPYILWGICALIVAGMSSMQEVPETWNTILMPVAFYAFGVILWFIPYTILVVGMWIWSRNKPARALYKLAILAPVLLSALMLIEVVLVSLPAASIAELAKDLLGQSALVSGFSLVFGYLCVGIAMGLYKFLLSRNMVKEETTLNIEFAPVVI